MSRWEFTEPRIRRLARIVGLPIDDADASELIDPLADIDASMKPIDRAPRDGLSVPDIAAESRPDPHNAFVTQCRVDPLEPADGPLAGSDVALKDNIALAGVELTAGSAVLSGYVPARSAPIVDRLHEAGATIVGKTNMDEFAFGPTGETSAFGPTKNPVDPDSTPGGSSSGSAAAVAAGDADLALGTDTGGSVRIPASFCGVYGFKPTRGRIPTDGIVELSRTLDTVGVLCRDLSFVERGFTVLADGAPRSETDPVDSSSLTVGVAESLFDRSSDVGAVIADALDRLEETGATVDSVEVPSSDLTSAIWRAITMSELYRYVASGGRPYRIPDASDAGEGLATALSANVDRFSPPLRQYLLMGAALVHDDRGRRYANARAHREAVRTAIDDAIAEVDVVACPTTPTTAFEFGSFTRATSRPINGNTHAFNLSGNPAISLPCGDVDGLPVGLQLVGPRGADRRLLAVAEAVDEALEGRQSSG